MSDDVESVLELMIDKGADPNIRNLAGDTVTSLIKHRLEIRAPVMFHHFQSPHAGKLAKLLLSAGADVKLQDKKGNTPLHIMSEAASTPHALRMLKVLSEKKRRK